MSRDEETAYADHPDPVTQGEAIPNKVNLTKTLLQEQSIPNSIQPKRNYPKWPWKVGKGQRGMDWS